MKRTLFIIFFILCIGLGSCATARHTPERADETPIQYKYTIGPSDVIKIDVWRHPEFSLTIPIDSRGVLRFPMVGDIKVLGMAPYEVADLLAEKLQEYIKKPQVRVNVTEYQSKRIVVMGAVKNPGIYYIDTDRLSVLEAAMIAGGFTVAAKRDHIQIARGGPGH